MARFWDWLWPRQRAVPSLENLRVVLYTRAGCHLCADANKVLHDARQRFGFALAAVDVDEDPELAACHGAWVPVVMVNGKLRFRGGVNPVLLTRLLGAELTRQAKKLADRAPD
jgi:glutaredoxin